ncbi:ArsR family transcriptional regulator, partial [Mesorhizobium sp. M7A.F.Ca.AU.002.02.1.1]
MRLEKAAAQLEALGNPTRLQLYRILVRAGDDGLAVGSVQGRLDIPSSTLSHHLKRLVDTGLV